MTNFWRFLLCSGLWLNTAYAATPEAGAFQPLASITKTAALAGEERARQHPSKLTKTTEYMFMSRRFGQPSAVS